METNGWHCATYPAPDKSKFNGIIIFSPIYWYEIDL